MSDNVEYLEDRKFILESLKEHKEDIRTLFQDMETIKISLNTLVVKMAGVTTIVGIVVGIIMKKLLG